MEAISFILLILFSLVGFSSGAVLKAGRFVQPKPQIIDLILISVIWSGAIYFRLALDFNKWLVILLWLILSSLTGILAVWSRKFASEKIISDKKTKETANNLLKRFWQSWRDFSLRMGEFQSRLILSLFFFTTVSPFALAVKMFSDPLHIRHQGNKSNWLPKMRTKINLEQFKRQF